RVVRDEADLPVLERLTVICDGTGDGITLAETVIAAARGQDEQGRQGQHREPATREPVADRIWLEAEHESCDPHRHRRMRARAGGGGGGGGAGAGPGGPPRSPAMPRRANARSNRHRSVLIGADDLAAITAAERAVGVHVDRLFQEMDGSVDEREIAAAGVM